MTEMCTPTGGLVNPAAFPVPKASPATLERQARDLRREGGTVAGLGEQIKSDWAGLSSCYSAPEDETLYAVVDPVATDGESVESSFDKAATALEGFAEEVREIQRKWTTLKSDAYTFLNSIDTSNDDWRKADGPWDRLVGNESEKVQEHQDLLDRADALRREYERAEIDCANALNAGIPDRTRFVGGDGSGEPPGDGVYEHGYDGYLGDVDMAWGGSVETDHGWWIDAGAAVKDFGVGIAEDVGGFLGAHSSEGWFQKSWGDALYEYHETNLQSLAGLVGMYDAESGDWGWSGWDTVGNAWKEAAHAVVPWEEWGDRPGYVIGTALLNIGATVGGIALSATGVGAVVGAPLLAWRGSAMLNKMGGGSGAPNVDLPDLSRIDLPHLPRFGGTSLADLDIDLSRLSGGAYSPTQLAEMGTLLERLNNQNITDAGSPDVRRASNGDGADGRPAVDPTTQSLRDMERFNEIVDDPDNAAFGREVNQRYQDEIAENDRRAKTDQRGAQGSWEGDGIEPDRPRDGLEAEYALVRHGDGDTLTAEAEAPRDRGDRVAGDRSVVGDGLHERFDQVVGDGFDSQSPQMRDRMAPVMNSDGGNGPVRGDGGDGSQGGTTVLDRDGGGNGPVGGDGGPKGGDTRPGSAGGALPTGRGDGPDSGAPVKDQPDLRRGSGDPLVPGEGKRFGDGVDLEPNSKYTLYEADGDLRTEYITDSDGKVREIRADSRGWDSKHPEFLDPRPDMTYKVDGYTYRTDQYGRTTSVEGTLHKEPNVRNEDEQSKVNSQGKDYYDQLNEKIREDFETDNGRPPKPGEVQQYQSIQWDGGHLIGYAEFFGIGERLNMAPMRFDVNQNRTNTALDDIPEEVRGGIEGSYRNIERSWRGIMRDGAKWHGFSNPKFNDGSWDKALALNPNDPKIDVQVTNVYDPGLPPVPDPKNPGKMLPPPPSEIEVRWSLNGVDMKVQRYNNVPPLDN